eukprot:63039_1
MDSRHHYSHIGDVYDVFARTPLQVMHHCEMDRYIVVLEEDSLFKAYCVSRVVKITDAKLVAPQSITIKMNCEPRLNVIRPWKNTIYIHGAPALRGTHMCFFLLVPVAIMHIHHVIRYYGGSVRSIMDNTRGKGEEVDARG